MNKKNQQELRKSTHAQMFENSPKLNKKINYVDQI